MILLSEAIKRLQALKREAGDMPIVSVEEVDGWFAIDQDRDFDVIEMPDENGQLKKSCAFMRTDFTDPTPNPPTRTRGALRLVSSRP